MIQPLSQQPHEFSDATTPSNPTTRSNRMVDILARLKKFSPAQVEKIQARATQKNEPFGKAAVALGLANRQDINNAIAIQFGYHFDSSERVNVPSALVTVAQPYSAMAEEFRLLRTQLLTTNNADAARLIAVAGVTPGTGSSFVAANLAVAFAQLGRRTLLIDARLRNPQIASLFETKAKTGLEDIMAGATSLTDALAPCCIRDLSLLCAPGKSHDPQEVLSSSSFADLISTAVERFDSIVIDTTTGARVADAHYVWALTQSVLMVARKNQTRMPEIRQLAKQVQTCGAQIAGTVIMG